VASEDSGEADGGFTEEDGREGGDGERGGEGDGEGVLKFAWFPLVLAMSLVWFFWKNECMFYREDERVGVF